MDYGKKLSKYNFYRNQHNVGPDSIWPAISLKTPINFREKLAGSREGLIFAANNNYCIELDYSFTGSCKELSQQDRGKPR